MKRFLTLLILLLLLPAIGLFVSYDVHEEMDSPQYSAYQKAFHNCDAADTAWRHLLTLPSFSFIQGHNYLLPVEAGGRQLSEQCRQWRQGEQLWWLSLLLWVSGALFPVLYWLSAKIAKTSKYMMVLIFPKLVKFSLLFLTVLMLGHGVIAALGLDIVQSFYFEQNYVWLTLFFVVGALSVVYTLFKVYWRIGVTDLNFIFGKRLSEPDYPKVYSIISLLAQNLDAQRPDNIVVGLDDNFFVSNQEAYIVGNDEFISGTTLYLSLPLCRLLSMPEIVTIIGHELGHFRGGDTEYTVKFAPIYRGLEQSLNDLHNFDGSLSLWSIVPANMLFFMHDIFLSAEGRMSRHREFEADQAAMDVGSPHALATSLMKLTLFSFLWDDTIEENSLRLERGLYTRNLSQTFANIVRYDVAHDRALMTIDEMIDTEISHPVDSHPTTAERILAVNNGVMPDFDLSDLEIPEQSAITIFDHYQALEEELTKMEHLHAIELRGLVVPEQDDEFDTLILKAVYYVLGELISIDDEIHESEIEVAEGIALHLIPGFEPVDFREACHHPEDYGDIWALADLLGQVFTQEGRVDFIDMMLKIANADAKFLEKEHSFIKKIRAIFNKVQAEEAKKDQANDA